MRSRADPSGSTRETPHLPPAGVTSIPSPPGAPPPACAPAPAPEPVEPRFVPTAIDPSSSTAIARSSSAPES